MTGNELFAIMLISLIIGGISLFLYYRLLYYRERQMENMYFLYAVRDDLIQLVADGHLLEDGFLFKEYYPMVNSLVDKINSFRFSSIIKAVSLQEEKIVGREFMERTRKELSQEPKHVKEVFDNFNKTICIIIYRNSLLFRGLIRFSLIYGVFYRVVTYFGTYTSKVPFITSQVKAHEYYTSLKVCP